MTSPTERPRDVRPCWAAVAGAALFGLGIFLSTRREWACSHRYWADGGNNHRSIVLLVVTFAGVAVAAYAGAVALRRAAQRRAPSDIVCTAVGFAPLVLVVPLVNLLTFDCSTG